MGFRKQLYKDFMKNPKQQYFDKLGKLLNLYRISKSSKKEVYDFVKQWYEG